MKSTGFKTDIRYGVGEQRAASMAVWARLMSPDNSEEISTLKRNLVRALQEDVTPRQREFLMLYYGERMNQTQIGELLGVDKSTVSRTIQRGTKRLQRCLRYGAANLLNMDD